MYLYDLQNDEVLMYVHICSHTEMRIIIINQQLSSQQCTKVDALNCRGHPYQRVEKFPCKHKKPFSSSTGGNCIGNLPWPMVWESNKEQSVSPSDVQVSLFHNLCQGAINLLFLLTFLVCFWCTPYFQISTSAEQPLLLFTWHFQTILFQTFRLQKTQLDTFYQ